MKNILNNKKIVFTGLVIIIVVMAIGLYFIKQQNDDLYRCDYGGFKGFSICYNGTIEEYNIDKDRKECKKAKITTQELNKLKNLVGNVKEEYEERSLDTNLQITDKAVLSKTESIYNKKEKKWIVLLDETKINTCEQSRNIIQFANELYEKYLKK